MTPEYLRFYKDIAKRNLGIGKYNPFPFGGITSFGEFLSFSRQEDFLGSNNVVKGYVEQLIKDFTIQNADGGHYYPVGTRYLELHFLPKRVDVYDGDFSHVVQSLAGASGDMMELATRLATDEVFTGVSLLGGNTNLTLANLAVRKLGFSFVNQLDAAKKRGTAAIYITRENLLGQQEALGVQHKKLLEYRIKRAVR